MAVPINTASKTNYESEMNLIYNGSGTDNIAGKMIVTGKTDCTGFEFVSTGSAEKCLLHDTKVATAGANKTDATCYNRKSLVN